MLCNNIVRGYAVPVSPLKGSFPRFFQGGDRRRVAVVRLQHFIAVAELSRTEGVWGQAAASVTPHSDPHRQPDHSSTYILS